MGNGINKKRKEEFDIYKITSEKIKILRIKHIIDEKLNQLSKEKSEYKFYWKSNEQHWNNNEEPEWTLFSHSDQILLYTSFKKFLIDQNKYLVSLNPPCMYIVDFRKFVQYHRDNPSKKRQIIFEDSINVLKNKTSEEKFFFFKKINFISLSNDNNIWIPFDSNDQVYLKNSFKIYLKNNKIYQYKLKNNNIINFNQFIENDMNEPKKIVQLLRILPNTLPNSLCFDDPKLNIRLVEGFSDKILLKKLLENDENNQIKSGLCFFSMNHEN